MYICICIYVYICLYVCVGMYILLQTKNTGITLDLLAKRMEDTTTMIKIGL